MISRQPLSLDRAATLLYDDPRPEPLLRQLLACSAQLVGTMAGSISMISGDGHRYVKLAERGASCRLGQTFPVDEGATGQVVARRRPVVLESYSEIPRGHLDSGNAATAGAVVAIPIWWRGELVGANVLFAGSRRRFTVAEIDDLDTLTQLAAAGLACVDADEATLSRLIRNRPKGAGGSLTGADPAGNSAAVDTVVTEVGTARQVPQGPTAAAPPPFTGREQQVLQLLAEGAGDKMIARQLRISQGTVEKHVGAVLRKTGASSRTAAVVRAMNRRWLTDGAPVAD